MSPSQNSTTPPVGAATPVATAIVAVNVTFTPAATLVAELAIDTVLAAVPVGRTVVWSRLALVAVR